MDKEFVKTDEFKELVKQYIYEVKELIVTDNLEQDSDISTAFDMLISRKLADRIIDNDNETLLKISKVGSFIRYIFDSGKLDNIEDGNEYIDMIYTLIDQKNSEDTPSEAAMEEVEELIKDTENELEQAESESDEDEDSNDNEDESDSDSIDE